MKLITKEVAARIPKLGETEGKSATEKKVPLKLFDPCGRLTYYVLEGSVLLSDGTEVSLNEVRDVWKNGDWQGCDVRISSLPRATRGVEEKSGKLEVDEGGGKSSVEGGALSVVGVLVCEDAESPAGDEEWICKTSGCVDGKKVGQTTSSGGGCAPQERSEGGRSSIESGSDAVGSACDDAHDAEEDEGSVRGCPSRTAEESRTVCIEDVSLFGYMVSPLGEDCDELGYASLKELSEVRNRFGLGIERDIHWNPDTTLAEAVPALAGAKS